MATNVTEFLKFHRLLVSGRPEYMPFYFPLAKGDKNPLGDRKWKDEKSRLTLDEAIQWMERGHNIGIAGTDKDGLVIIDIDNEDEIKDIKPSLSTRSRKRTGKHYFYFTTDANCKVNIPTEECGEIRANWQYVVAAGSFVNTDIAKLEKPIPESQNVYVGRYTVEDEVTPSNIVFDEFPKMFRERKEKAKEKIEPKKNGNETLNLHPDDKSALYKLTIENVVGSAPNKARFSSLFHGSDTGANTSIKDGLLHCWRHNVSHSPLTALAVMAGIADCVDAGYGHSNSGVGGSTINLRDGETIYKLWNFAKTEGIIPQDDKMPYRAREWLNIQEMNAKKNRVDDTFIELPREGVLISKFAREATDILKTKDIIFFRIDSREIVEIRKLKIKEDGEDIFTGFASVKPNRFITLAETFFTPFVWRKNDKKEWEEKNKSMGSDLANTLLCSEIMQSGLPKINRIFTIPLPILYNNELTFPVNGYDKRFNSWLPFDAPQITKTDMPLEEAKEIIKLTLHEFCFQTHQDYINSIAGLLTPFLRGLFPEFNTRTPVFFYIANRERAGKDYLAGITGILYEGHALEEAPISTSENVKHDNSEELRKKLLSALIGGRKRLHFANNKGYINNAVFEMIITAKKYSDRVLGRSETLTFDNEMDYSLSGNAGIGFTPDLANRCRFIRLFLEMEDANSRQFNNPNLHTWVAQNRSLILSALYTLVRNWIETGKKKSSIPFASFSEWSDICGGVMEAAGYDNPCTPDKENVKIKGDSETTDIKTLFEICYDKKPQQWIKKSEITKIIELDDSNLFGYLDFDKKADQTKFGMKFLKYIGRVFSDIQLIVKDSEVRAARQEFMFTKNIEKTKKEDIFCNIVGNLGSLGNPNPVIEANQNNTSGKKGGEQVANVTKVTKEPVSLENILKWAKLCGEFEFINLLDTFGKDQESEINKCLFELKHNGDVFEPQSGFFKVV